MEKIFKKPDNTQFKKETSWLLEEKYHGEKTDTFFLDIARLKKGEPIDYVIGFTSFLDCHIDLSDFPLIPRTETEFWVEHAIKEISARGATPAGGQGSASGGKKEPIRCLDLFSGSGCIGIALAHHIKRSTVDFGDNKKNCLEQIQKNIKKNKIENSRINIYKSDCFENIPKKKYNYIFANPPYIAREREKNVQRSVMKWESHDALFAENDGLYYIKKIIQEAPAFLKKNGTIFIEFDSWQKEATEKLIFKDTYKCTFWKDQFGKWRTVVLQRI